jgi:hypothetical protein
MSTGRHWLHPQQRGKLLRFLMQHFARDGTFMSFEGWLPAELKQIRPQADLATLPSFSRQTSVPVLDYVAIPLSEPTMSELLPLLADETLFVGDPVPILHIQIGDRDRLFFGAYDGFHEECVIAYAAVPLELLNQLKAEGIILHFRSDEEVKAERAAFVQDNS